jgi:hypothetical protein
MEYAAMTRILTLPEQRELLKRAAVPEHSVAFMQAMSGGTAFCEQGFLFLYAEDWLMAVGYPLQEGEKTGFDAAFDEAVKRIARGRRIGHGKTLSCFAIAPDLPERLHKFIRQQDWYYTLDTAQPIPRRLRAIAAKAAEKLTVTEDRQFGPAHRRLWAEFLARTQMQPDVRELYARTEAVLAAGRASVSAGDALLDVRLLNAHDAAGNLAASLLLDYSPKDFCTYIVGTHSRAHYTPHATDLLFASMLQNAAREGKRHIHAGLGVNEGIARFKRKWGGRPEIPYVMASWQETGRDGCYLSAPLPDADNAVMRYFFSNTAELSKQQIFDTLPRQRDFAMLFEVTKDGARSFLGGSAHFFRYSFSFFFQKLFEPLHTVIFEGSLDEDFLAAVERDGRSPPQGAPCLAQSMTEDDIARLERVVYGPQGAVARLFGFARPRTVNVRELLEAGRPWFAFFSLWAAFLERLGWDQSVDMEAWRTAREMGKTVMGMESLHEQLDSLNSIPIARIVEYFRHCGEWPAYAKRNVKMYLAGDLPGMFGTSVEFPTRTEQVIGKRDECFRQRMRPYLEAGNCAVFVGSAHLVGLVPLLQEDGFSVRQMHSGLWSRVRRKLFGGNARSVE